MTIVPMINAFARDISAWTYPDPYAVYSFEPTGETLQELTGGDYFACVDERGLIGYVCYGAAARIPVRDETVYQRDCLDIGLGLSPELCGKGLGAALLCAGTAFAYNMSSPNELRLAVASFNKRAIALYLKCGFIPERTTQHAHTSMPFLIMTKPLS